MLFNRYTKFLNVKKEEPNLSKLFKGESKSVTILLQNKISNLLIILAINRGGGI